MGFHPSQLCYIDNFHTIYLTPKEQSQRLKSQGSFELCEFDFLLDARPLAGSFFTKTVFYMKKTFMDFQKKLMNIQPKFLVKFMEYKLLGLDFLLYLEHGEGQICLSLNFLIKIKVTKYSN